MQQDKVLAAPKKAPNRQINDYSYYRADPAQDFPVLPEGMQRDGFLKLVDEILPYLDHKVSNQAFETFRKMAEATRPTAWRSKDQEPLCYMAQTRVAEIRRITPSRVRSHEAELVAAGLIERRTAANGARSNYGQQGFNFSPAIARAGEFEAMRQYIEDERREKARLRGLRSTHKRHLKSVLAEFDELGLSDARMDEITLMFFAWPSAGMLHRMPMRALESHETEADDLCREALVICDKASYTSGRPLVNERSYIQDTTEETLSVNCNEAVDKVSAGKPSHSKPKTPPSGGEERRENKNEAASAAHKSEFLAKLGPKRLYELASDEMKLYLDGRSNGGALLFHDFVVVAQQRLRELGINHSAWRDAVKQMGEDTATMCVLVLDANRNHPDTPVQRPGAYLRGMTERHLAGELNLVGSLIGMTERKRDYVH